MDLKPLRWCFCAGVVLLPVLAGADNYYVQWSDTINNGALDLAWGVTVDNSNNFIVTGQSTIGANEDYFTVKYSPGGTILWRDTINNGSYDIAYSVATDNVNNIAVTGISWFGGGGDFFTVKYDSNGAVLWTHRINNGGTDRARGVAIDHDNNVIVSGFSQIGADYDWLTVKYSPDGTVLWIDTLDTGFEDYTRGVAVDNSNNIIVTGFCTRNGDHDYLTVKFDPSGAVIWADTVDFGGWDVALGVAVDNSDNVIVTGRSNIGSYQYCTVKYDPNGSVLWADTFAQGVEANGVTVDRDNSIFITGVGVGTRFLTVKYDSAGSMLWYDFLVNGVHDWAYGVVADNNDNIIVAGATEIGGVEDLYTVRYAPTFADSIALFAPDPCTLVANGFDSTRVRSGVYDNIGARMSGMTDSVSFSARLGGFYGDVIEDPADTAYCQWYRAGTVPGIDTIWTRCPPCATVDSARTEIVLVYNGIATDPAGDHADPRILGIHPNPFHSAAKIRCVIPGTGSMTENPELTIYNAAGRLVKSFDCGSCIADRALSIRWDGRDDQNRILPSGIYFTQLGSGGLRQREKIILIR